MPVAVVDANVLVSWRLESDQNHRRGNEICTAASNGELPKLRVPYPFLQEAVKHVHNDAGLGEATKTYEAVRADEMFVIVYPNENDYRRGYALFETTSDLELPDAVGVAYMRRVGVGHIYSFDSGFDGKRDIERWNTAHDPYAP
ncbi:MAG: type II toxin-antitoxin system VapC family toxin [Halobaculum sp.]